MTMTMITAIVTMVFLNVVDGQYYGRNMPCPKSYLDPDGDCVAGIGGKDYPLLASMPKTSFDCREHPVRYIGYFADVEAKCQVFHVCLPDGQRDSFLCPNGTLFNQQFLVCDWWFNVQCRDAATLYTINDYLQAPVNFRSGPTSPNVVPIPISADESKKKPQSLLSTLLFGPSDASAADKSPSSASHQESLAASMSYQNPNRLDVGGALHTASKLFANLMSFVKPTPNARDLTPVDNDNTHIGSGSTVPSNWMSSVIQPRTKSRPAEGSSTSGQNMVDDDRGGNEDGDLQRKTTDKISAPKLIISGLPR